MTGKPMTAEEVDALDPLDLTERERRFIATIQQQNAEIERLSEICPCCGGLGQMDPGSHAACDPCKGTGRQSKGTEQAATQRDRLREAAQPFADYANQFDGPPNDLPDTAPINTGQAPHRMHKPTIGNCRKIRAALTTEPADG